MILQKSRSSKFLFDVSQELWTYVSLCVWQDADATKFFLSSAIILTNNKTSKISNIELFYDWLKFPLYWLSGKLSFAIFNIRRLKVLDFLFTFHLTLLVHSQNTFFKKACFDPQRQMKMII